MILDMATRKNKTVSQTQTFHYLAKQYDSQRGHNLNSYCSSKLKQLENQKPLQLPSAIFCGSVNEKVPNNHSCHFLTQLSNYLVRQRTISQTPVFNLSNCYQVSSKQNSLQIQMNIIHITRSSLYLLNITCRKFLCISWCMYMCLPTLFS